MTTQESHCFYILYCNRLFKFFKFFWPSIPAAALAASSSSCSLWNLGLIVRSVRTFGVDPCVCGEQLVLPWLGSSCEQDVLWIILGSLVETTATPLKTQVFQFGNTTENVNWTGRFRYKLDLSFAKWTWELNIVSALCNSFFIKEVLGSAVCSILQIFL
jgi:hypothetical protein